MLHMGDISYIHVYLALLLVLDEPKIHLKPYCIYHNIVTMQIARVFKGVWINIYPFLGYAFVHLHVLTLAYMYYITRMNNEPMGCMVKMFGTQTNQWSNIILEWWDHTHETCVRKHDVIYHQSVTLSIIRVNPNIKTIKSKLYGKRYANNPSIWKRCFHLQL